jgi:hypothetical protein
MSSCEWQIYWSYLQQEITKAEAVKQLEALAGTNAQLYILRIRGY